jgi:type VI secretion system secreted protein Hcp
MRVLQGKAVRRSLIVVAGAVALAVPAQAPAATNSYLQLDGIQGESTGEGFPGAIDVKDWSWGASKQGAAAKATTKELTVKKDVDKSSPTLLQKLYNNQTIRNGSLTVTKSDGESSSNFLVLCFGNMRVTAVDLANSEETPEETVSFNFTSIAEREAASSFTFGWDLMRYVATGAPSSNCPGTTTVGGP